MKSLASETGLNAQFGVKAGEGNNFVLSSDKKRSYCSTCYKLLLAIGIA